jgi:hypothetical protein
MIEWLKRHFWTRRQAEMIDDPGIEGRFLVAKERFARAMRALAPKHQSGEWEQYHAAKQELLGLERQMAAARNEQYAEPIEFPVKWDTGAPLPHLLVNDYRAFLAFLISEPDPAWDGTYCTVKDPTSGQVESLALVEFEHCHSAKLGSPNDEVFNGHPLYGKGMEPYSAQRVVNSEWLREMERINSVHSRYRPDSWRGLNHYVFWFHDTTFECVAESFRVETFRESMKSMLNRMVERLIS